jgi:glycerol-3-phosphate acyltransferase PlsY
VTEQPESLPASPSKRPIGITAICVLSGIGIVFTIPLIVSEAAASIGAWYPPFLALSGAVGAACTVGFWLMRRWAVYLYTGFLCLTQIVLLAMGAWNIVALLIPLAVVMIGFIYLPRME